MWLLQALPEIIQCQCPVNERRHYSVTPFLIGWAHTQNDPWITEFHDEEIKDEYRAIFKKYCKCFNVFLLAGTPVAPFTDMV